MFKVLRARACFPEDFLALHLALQGGKRVRYRRRWRTTAGKGSNRARQEVLEKVVSEKNISDASSRCAEFKDIKQVVDDLLDKGGYRAGSKQTT